MDIVKLGVAGVGHFGRVHALKAASSPRAQLIGVYDLDAERARSVGWEAGAPSMPLEELIAASDAIIIATPAEVHHDIAMAAMRAGRHVLIEKPIASTLAEADALAAVAREQDVVLQVGHLERFSAGHGAVSARMGHPLYIEAVRVAPFKIRGTDVSVILDLMIHDLDLVLALVDAPIESIDAVGAIVSSAHEDIANARVRFTNGCVATITASRISLKTERKMRIFSQTGYLAVDFASRRLTAITRDLTRGMPVPGMPEFTVEEISWEDHDALAAEHAAFFSSILDGAPVLVDAAGGRRALDAALAVGSSMERSHALVRASGLLSQQFQNGGGGGV